MKDAPVLGSMGPAPRLVVNITTTRQTASWSKRRGVVLLILIVPCSGVEWRGKCCFPLQFHWMLTRGERLSSVLLLVALSAQAIVSAAGTVFVDRGTGRSAAVLRVSRIDQTEGVAATMGLVAREAARRSVGDSCIPYAIRA